MGYQTALDALADGTRRRIIEQLRRGPAPVGAIAARVPVSRPAVSRHLRVLEDAGLVAHESIGTRNVYRVEPKGLVELRGWLESFWDEALDSFAVHAAAKTRKGRR